MTVCVKRWIENCHWMSHWGAGSLCWSLFDTMWYLTISITFTNGFCCFYAKEKDKFLNSVIYLESNWLEGKKELKVELVRIFNRPTLLPHKIVYSFYFKFPNFSFFFLKKFLFCCSGKIFFLCCFHLIVSNFTKFFFYTSHDKIGRSLICNNSSIAVRKSF